ncbi:putative transcription factor ovo-like protein 3 [Penaeus indicus]|uniref:putative transcription factor ovo-like protein 3 n=1 Tax=Penaeus indicus TaxID=29960 RepID=UPI00300C09F9
MSFCWALCFVPDAHLRREARGRSCGSCVSCVAARAPWPAAESPGPRPQASVRCLRVAPDLGVIFQVASRDPQARPQGHSHLSTSEVAIARALLTIPEQSAAFSSAAAAAASSSSSSPFNPSALPKRTLASAPRRSGAMAKHGVCAVSAPSVSISSAGHATPMATLRCSTCPECGKIFRGDYHKYNLKKHLTIHAGLRPFPCPVCNLAFNQKVSMKRHFASVHRSVDPIAPVSQ